MNHGGSLPEGVRFADDSLELAEDFEVPAPLLPQHRLLKETFVLKSQASMLTYNSRRFTKQTWPEFKEFLDALAKELGATAWACCLEASTKASDTNVFHTHAYLLWTDGVSYRSEGLQRLVFQDVRPRVDKCSQGSNERVPRRGALHGLWYVSVEKLGTEFSYATWVAWRDYVPSRQWLVSLNDAHKLTQQQCLSLSVAFGTGHAERRRDAVEITRDRTRQAEFRTNSEGYSGGIQKEFGGNSVGIRGYSDHFRGIRLPSHVYRHGSYHTGGPGGSAQVTFL